MEARAEARDLKTSPLPPDLTICTPSHIADLEAEIARVQETLSRLTREHDEALAGAVKVGNLEDDTHLLKLCSKMNPRSINLQQLQVAFPKEFNQIVTLQKEIAMKKAEETVSIKNVEVFISKAELEKNRIYQDNGKREWYEVHRKKDTKVGI